MVRSFFALLSLAIVVSIGCSPEAAKDMTSKAASGVADAAKNAAGDALAGVEGGSEMLKQVTEMFGKVTSTLGAVKDEASATSALPELGKLTEGFGGMTEMFSKMPDAAKTAVAGAFQSSLGQLKPIIDKVMAIPGVEAILKPAIDALMSKLDAFKA